MNQSPTDPNQDTRLRELRLPIVVLACAIVLLFRAAAWLNPSSAVVIPDSLRLPVGGLGVLFLACGVWAWVKSPSILTRVYLACGIGGGLHWGGTVAAENSGLETALLVFYIAGTAMADGAFLDLSLRYPWARRRRRFRTLGFYLLAILTLIAVPIAPFLPSRIVEAGLGFAIGVAFLMSIAGGVVFLVKWFRATAAERREYALTPIVVVLVVATVLDLLADAGTLPGNPEAWTLTYGLEPIVLAWALTRRGVGAAVTS